MKNFKKEKEQNKDLELNKFSNNLTRNFTIKTPENKDVEVELTCTAGLIQTSQINYEEIVRKEFYTNVFQ